MGKNGRHVVKHPDGWAVRAAGAKRASAHERTQDSALDRFPRSASGLRSHAAGGGVAA